MKMNVCSFGYCKYFLYFIAASLTFTFFESSGSNMMSIKEWIPNKNIERSLAKEFVACSGSPEKIKLACSQWLKLNVADQDLFSTTMKTFTKFEKDVSIIFDTNTHEKDEEEMSNETMMIMEAKNHLLVGLNERSIRSQGNKLIESCLMYLIEKARTEQDQYYFFRLKFMFLLWSLAPDEISYSQDMQTFLFSAGRPFGNILNCTNVFSFL